MSAGRNVSVQFARVVGASKYVIGREFLSKNKWLSSGAAGGGCTGQYARARRCSDCRLPWGSQRGGEKAAACLPREVRQDKPAGRWGRDGCSCAASWLEANDDGCFSGGARGGASAQWRATAPSPAGRRRRACVNATHTVGAVARRGRREDESFGTMFTAWVAIFFALIPPCARVGSGDRASAKFGATDAGAKDQTRLGV